ncbi:uncharacterized protein LOC101460782 isoform X2 [Ceratitis capitata]|uniref:uncharacterized protein LOC101460782 isoform X2 n=1 Tax=Ceratitis capitata TaxID=7213 RepID=UPI00032981AF|nr:uncharacterized protein LOC101460782 isoform X2 [Ceratitis capitata]
MDSVQKYVNNAQTAGIHKNQSVMSGANKVTKRRRELSPREKQTKTKELKSASKENLSPSLGSHQFPKVFEQTCESAAAKQPHIGERLIHLLAIQPLTMSELKSRLSTGGMTKDEKLVVSSLMPLITRLERKLYHLKCNVWDEVDENWPHYTDEERQKVKLRKHFYLALPPEGRSEASCYATPSGNYKKHKTITPKIQRPREDNKSTNPHNNQRLPELVAKLQVEESCFVRKHTNPGKHSSQRERTRNNATITLSDGKSSIKTANTHAQDVDVSTFRSCSNVETETKGDEHQQRNQADLYRPWEDDEVTDFLITLLFDDDKYRKTEDLSAYKMLVKKNPCFADKLPLFDAADFPLITKERQRRHYRAMFKRSEDLYRRLHAHNNALTSEFWTLRAQFEAAEEFSEKRIEIYVRYHRCYHLIYSENELKKRAHLDYLHELRKHLLLRVTEYDNPALAVKAKEQLQGIEEELQERISNTKFMVRNLITLHPIERLGTERGTGLSDISSQSESEAEDDGQYRKMSLCQRAAH